MYRKVVKRAHSLPQFHYKTYFKVIVVLRRPFIIESVFFTKVGYTHSNYSVGFLES